MTQEREGTGREDDADGGEDGAREAGQGEQSDLRRGAEPVEDETSQFGGPEGGQPTGS